MYLTRMRLDVRRRDTMKAFSNPNMLHGAVEGAFPGEKKRRLWRIDCLNGEYFLLIVSDDEPDLTKAAKQFGVEDGRNPWETKDYDVLLNRIKAGDCWHFRLTANPTVSHLHEDKADGQDCSNEKSRGKVCAYAGVEGQKEWLRDRAARHGFELDADGFDTVHQDWHVFNKSAGNKARVSILGVTYEGVLKVTDAELFRQTLCRGIGRAKAYGMGMLTVADQFRVEQGDKNE